MKEKEGGIVNFTNDQREAINGLTKLINEKFSKTNSILGLIGAGGTGKTFVTNYIIKHCMLSDSTIFCTSPTHKACRIFSQAIENKVVKTIQSTFGFRLNVNIEDFDPENPNFKPIASPKLDGCALLIIDEASMLNASLVNYIINICADKSIKILFIGDSNQLAPVNEKVSTAFKRCVKVYELKEIVRQKEENPIGNLLKMLRRDIDNKTNEFINYIGSNVGKKDYNNEGEGYSICGYEEFCKIIKDKFNDDNYSKDISLYRIIAYTNAKVASWNNFVRNEIIKDSDKNVITKHDLLMSYTSIVDDYLATIISNSEEYIINNIVNYNDKNYNMKGFLVRLQKVNGGQITPPLFIIDHRDKYTISMYHKIISELIENANKASSAMRSAAWKKYYDFTNKHLLAANIINKNGKIIYSRDIDYGFAITSHKSQGSTYENVFIDANDIIYDSKGFPYPDKDDMLRRLYVACSRAKKSLIICYGR